MTVIDIDLGEAEPLIVALGLATRDGENLDFNGEWLAKPSDSLKKILTDPGQRDALEELIDLTLGSIEPVLPGVDGAPATWLPIVDSDDPNVTLAMVVDTRAGDVVDVGLGVRAETNDPISGHLEVHVPLFRVGAGDVSPGERVLLGGPDGAIRISGELTVDRGVPVPGQAFLGGIALSVTIPTDGASDPTFGFTLRQLQLPGGDTAADYSLDADGADALEEELLELVVALIEAQAEAVGGAAVTRLAALLGVGPNAGTIVPFPFAAIVSGDGSALQTWFTNLVTSSSALESWIDAWAELLGGSSTGTDLTFALGSHDVTVRFAVAANPQGQTLLTPRVSVAKVNSDGDVAVKAEVDLVSINLATGAVVALPAVSLLVDVGPSSGTLFSTGAGATLVSAEGIRCGLTLDADRRLVPLLQIRGATIANTTHPVLDLSSPQQIADAAEDVGRDLLDAAVDELQTLLEDALGDFASLLTGILGLTPPGGVDGLDIAAFLADPLGALRTYWLALLQSEDGGGTPQLITVLRPLLDLLIDGLGPGPDISGSGTEPDPWRLALIGDIDLILWREIDGDPTAADLTAADTLLFGLESTLAIPTPVGGGATFGGRFRATVVRANLATPKLTFVPSLAGELSIVGVDDAPLLVTVSPEVSLEADACGLIFEWTPDGGIAARPHVDGLALQIDGTSHPIDLDRLLRGDRSDIDDAGWSALENLAQLLVDELDQDLLNDLVELFGWGGTDPKLRLEDLLNDPVPTVQRWLVDLLQGSGDRDSDDDDDDGDDRDAVAEFLELISRGLTDDGGAGLPTRGTGTWRNPWRVGLVDSDAAPSAALWTVPDGARPPLNLPASVQDWESGLPALPTATLVEALEDTAEVAADVADLIRGRTGIDEGLELLAELWEGTDGFLTNPGEGTGILGSGLDAVEVHQLVDAAGRVYQSQLDLDDYLSGLPDVTIHVRVALDMDAAALWPDVDPARLIDLTAPSVGSLTTLASSLPAAATGDWFVALSARAAIDRLADDPDGTRSQSDRLQAVIDHLGDLGTLALVGYEAAGHAARMAAQINTAVDHLVTAGTPWLALVADVLDDGAAGAALRLLRATLGPAASNDDPEGAEAARIRSLLNHPALTGFRTEFDLPEGGIGSVRGTLDAHAVFATLEADDIARSITAAVASGLGVRSDHRVANAPDLTAAGFGVYLGIAPDSGTGALSADITARIDVGQLDIQTGLPELQVAPELRVDLALYRNDGWIIGGPGTDADMELRALTAELVLPLGGDATAAGRATIVLHEPTIAGVRRHRWEIGVQPSDFGPDVTVTGVLPEVQQLLDIAIDALLDDPSIRNEAIQNALEALGIIVDDALPTDVVNELIHNPRGLVRDALDSALGRDRLLNALAVLLGQDPSADGVLTWTVGPLQLTVDIPNGTVGLTGASDADGPGIFTWDLSATLGVNSATPTFAASATVGAESSLVGGMNLSGQIGDGPATLSGTFTPRGAAPLAFTLLPNVGGPSLTHILQTTVPAVITQLAFDVLQRTEPAVTEQIVAVLDALGLLEALDDAVDAGERTLRSIVEFTNTTAAWLEDVLSNGADLSAEKLQDLIDAVKAMFDGEGPAGVFEIAAGITIGIGDAATPELQVGIDSSVFARDPGLGLAAGLDVAVPLTPGAPIVPVVDARLDFINSNGATTLPSLRVTSSPELRVVIERSPDVELHPNPDGISLLLTSASAAAVAVVPLVLNEVVVAGSAPGAPVLLTTAANIVSTAGDALDLRTAGSFDPEKIERFAADPVGDFADRSGQLASAAIDQLSGALGTAVSDIITVASSGTELTIATNPVTVGPVTATPVSLTVDFAAASLTLDLDVLDVGFLGDIQGRFTVDTTGAADAALGIGPATIDVGGSELHPFVRILSAGEDDEPQLDIGLADNGDVRFGLAPSLAADGSSTAVWWRFGFPLSARLLALTDAGESDDAADIALAGLDILTSLLLGYALEIEEIQQLLDKPLVASSPDDTIRDLLDGVLLDGSDVIDRPFDPSLALERLANLITNLSEHLPPLELPGGLTVELSKTGDTVGVLVDIANRLEIPAGDLIIWFDTDASWISDGTPAGLQLDLVDVVGNNLTFSPGLTVGGLGIGVGRSGGALIEGPVSLGSVQVHGFARISSSEFSGGAQIGLNEFSVRLQGGGNNDVAQGILNDANSDEQALAPTFSPRVAVQKHGSDDIMLTLSLGPDTGPWWLAVQRNFGPIYIEQVGVGVVVVENDLESISVYLDGRMALFGLTASVDDLQLTYTFGAGSIFEIDRWSVDVAGFGIAADMGGLMLTGGLAKFESAGGIEYIGTLTARFAVYGISVFGGYGTFPGAGGEPFMSFFAFGALNAPIGGPPAFFLTGIGGGFGINRALEIPLELDQFATNPLIAALDPAAEASDDPIADLVAIRDMFPPEQGTFWFAAGISFTSFALVDGVAVVAVEIGDGLEIALLGLARLALPRPQFPLVSIELGLIARFSSSEGVLWIQAQLTDNSWLLHESVRLTGGFAFVMWFSGDRAGQFVITIGGYHPRFAADGYPEVPRLGFNWSVASNIVVKGGGYFALTSEALMAGGELVASATFGPAFAEVRFEANAIVYFDPFFFEVDVSARISAGVTINLLFCKKTIRVSLSAAIRVSGPRIYGEATVEVGPVSLTVAFGDQNQERGVLLSWADFVAKYLEQGDTSSSARAITALAGKGSRAPGAEEGAEQGETPPADGTPTRPFEVEAEFELTITTTVPIVQVEVEGHSLDPVMREGPAVAAAPLGEASLAPVLDLTIEQDPDPDTSEENASFDRFRVDVLNDGAFPAGVWGPAPSSDDPAIPQGEVVPAATGVVLTALTELPDRSPEMKAEQVEPGDDRHPLPLTVQAQSRRSVARQATALRKVVADEPTIIDITTADDALAVASTWLARGKLGAASLASYAGERSAPPLFASLGENIFGGTDQLSPGRATTRQPVAPTPRPLGTPRAVALFRAGGIATRRTLGTTVNSASLARVAAPTLDGVNATIAPVSAARLLLKEPPVQASGKTIRSINRPVTTSLNSASTLTRQTSRVGRSASGTSVLDTLTSRIARKAIGSAAELAAGEAAIFDLPNSRYDRSADRPQLTSTQTMRMIVMGAGGQVLLDTTDDRAEVPRGADRLVMMNVGDRVVGAPSRAAGWHTSQSLPYLGWKSLLAHGAVVRMEDGRSRKQPFAWTPAGELNKNAGRVITRFAAGARTVAVALVGPGDGSTPDIALAVQPADGSANAANADNAANKLGASDPTILRDGPHVTLIYEISGADGTVGTDEPFQITASTAGRWRVAGVLAWDLPAVEVQAIVETRPLSAAATTPNGGGATAARIQWTPPEGTS